MAWYEYLFPQTQILTKTIPNLKKYFGGGSSNTQPASQSSNKVYELPTVGDRKAASTTSNRYSNSEIDKLIAAMKAGTPSVPTPKPFTYSWDSATASAKKAITPYYQKEWQNYMKRANLAKTQRQTQSTRTIEDIASELGQFLEDTGIKAGRTKEDVSTNIGELGQELKYGQKTEGMQATGQREAKLEELSQGAGLYGGVGQQELSQQDKERRVVSERATQQYLSKRKGQETYLNRTLGDIATSETRAKTQAEKSTAREKVDLDAWVKDWALANSSQKRTLELKKQGDILNKASSIWQSQVSKYNLGLTPQQRAAGYSL